MNKILMITCMVVTIGAANGAQNDTNWDYFFRSGENNSSAPIRAHFPNEDKKETKTWTKPKSKPLSNDRKNYNSGKPKHLKRRYDSKNEYNQKNK